MCGIAGIINLNGKATGEGVLKEMAEAERHRGPDDSGIFTTKHCGLGHVRLSIIDLSKDGHQPMPNEDSTVFVVHNGEIYNYLELKQELERLGHHFRSKSDTEVILHSYEEWGYKCQSHFNGMWSFAVLDLKKDILFCSRDRFGVKPFYYYMKEGLFVFASEIKAVLCHPDIKKRPNDRSIFRYLYSGYGYMDVSDETFFDGIKQLKPGHYIKLSIGERTFTETRYWDLDPGKKISFPDEKDAFWAFYELFEDSVRLRLRSDVPLGVSLSGGLDSSSIACIAARLMKGAALETFSSCYEEASYDERRFIQPVLDRTGARPNFIFTKPDRLFEEIDEIIWHQEEPYSTLSILPQWYIMKLAREKGVKVLLTGQGGDETLAGYHKYYFYLFADLIYHMHWKTLVNEIKLYRDLPGANKNIFKGVSKILLSNTVPRFVKDALLAPVQKSHPKYLDKDFIALNSSKVHTERKFGSILNNDLYNALKISPLPSLLHIDDRSSMAHSVESRAPFLDYRLVEFLFSLGPEYKIRNGSTKYILRESLNGILPDEVRLRRDKMGFATPLEQWFRTSLKDKVADIFNSTEFLSRPYFNNREVLRTFDNFVNGQYEPGLHLTIWGWVNLELWFRKFMR